MYKKILCLSACLFMGSAVWATTDSSIKIVQKDTDAVTKAIELFDSGYRGAAFASLKAVENTGDVRVLARLGWCYFSGAGVDFDTELAYQYFKRGIDDPDGFGIDGLGICYGMGLVVPRDIKKAEELHKKAVAMGNLHAAGNLALLYKELGNNAESIRYWQMCYNGKMHKFFRGHSAYMIGVLQSDIKLKIAWLEAAVRLDYPKALSELSALYHLGDAGEINIPKALEYAKKYAETSGDFSFYAGIAYEWAIEKMFLCDYENAEKYMRIALENGLPYANWYLFRITGDSKYALAAAENGDARGYGEAGVYLDSKNQQKSEETLQKIKQYYQLAFEQQDNHSLNALCNLAATYAANKDAENIQKALELHKEAANWYFPRGLRSVGMIYVLYSRQATNEQDKQKYALLALEYMAAAILENDKVAMKWIDAISTLAEQYSDTVEAKFFKGAKLASQALANKDKKSLETAYKQIQLTADNGCVLANMIMGLCGNSDIKTSAEYLRKVAVAGNLHAKWLLGGDAAYMEIVPTEERIKYLQELMAIGNKKARLSYALILEEQGKIAEAIKEYRINIAAGHSDSMTFLYLLLNRQNDEKSKQEADKLLEEAIIKDNGFAQCLAGYECLQNPTVSPKIGMFMMMKGVIDGTSNTEYFMHEIAMNYAIGRGAAKSSETAKIVAEMMLEQGYAYGFYTMGKLYQSGALGKENIEKAKEYYQNGADNGIMECIKILEDLKKN